jgi:ABC-2 type transport system ATP-binding protein
VFLTTQYLEEADVLADRVGIIHHCKIVAEGTPPQLKAQIGRSSLEAEPALEEDRQRLAGVLARFGEPTAASPRAEAVRFGNGDDLTDVVRALDAEGIRVASLTVHEPTLDDVFLAKTGYSLEGAGDEESEPGQMQSVST